MSEVLVLPSPERLAALVSNVTETMLGITFRSDSEPVGPRPATFRTALLPIPGKHPMTVALSSDFDGCAALSAAMFSVPAKDVDHSMINDSLCELVNMTAGLLKSVLKLDQALGLPRVIAADDNQLHDSRSVVLRANGLGLILWISPGAI